MQLIKKKYLLMTCLKCGHEAKVGATTRYLRCSKCGSMRMINSKEAGISTIMKQTLESLAKEVHELKNKTKEFNEFGIIAAKQINSQNKKIDELGAVVIQLTTIIKEMKGQQSQIQPVSRRIYGR